ncbi:MAG: nucleotide exchange factor GrpE [Candidatus Bathyarchaeia archaeon]|nr:nucleotide exchange factor GrpE [Candidatus Bathyarchaeota archaeon]
MSSQANVDNATQKENNACSETVKNEIESLKKALEAEKARAEEYLNRLKYLQADFENYIKKVKKDFENAIKFSSEKLILNLIDVIEDFERVLQTEENFNSINNKALLEGVKLIYKKLKNILENEGVKQIEAVGKIFNPAFHEAVGFIETSEHPEGTIVKELRKGYFLGDKVIKPSIVEVAKAPPSSKK